MAEGLSPSIYLYFFFFQAEDGIRDGHVTGVQTCALPIYKLAPRGGRDHYRHGARVCAGTAGGRRSEERRVGKECRSRWGADHEKKKNEKNGNDGSNECFRDKERSRRGARST